VFAASEQDPALDGLVSEFVAELSYHVVNLAICLNPERIAVGGGMAGSWERLRPGLHDALRAGVPFPPELVPARFPSDAPLIGAVGLAVDAARDGGAPLYRSVKGYHYETPSNGRCPGRGGPARRRLQFRRLRHQLQ
jgi:hypothetical protein